MNLTDQIRSFKNYQRDLTLKVQTAERELDELKNKNKEDGIENQIDEADRKNKELKSLYFAQVEKEQSLNERLEKQNRSKQDALIRDRILRLKNAQNSVDHWLVREKDSLLYSQQLAGWDPNLTTCTDKEYTKIVDNLYKYVLATLHESQKCVARHIAESKAETVAVPDQTQASETG